MKSRTEIKIWGRGRTTEK